MKTGLSPIQVQAFERDMERLEKVCQIQVDFLLAYRENYSANLVVIVGNKFNYGHDFARFLAGRFVSKVCILEGGIDAFKEHPQGKEMLRKGRAGQQSEADYVSQYERFVKKSASLKAKRAQRKTQQ